MSWLLHAFFTLWAMLSLHHHAGIATKFSAKHDKFNPRPYAACLHRVMDDATDFIVAHRSLPCLADVLICLPRTGKCAKARVGDRGPYGKSVLDLSPLVAKALGHNGFERVVFSSD